MGRSLPAPPCAPGCPVFKKICARGAHPGPEVENPPILVPRNGLPMRPKAFFFLRRGGVLTARKSFLSPQGGFRRLRAATYFAHGGKVGKTPPGTHPMGYGSASLRLAHRLLSPDPNLRGLPLGRCAALPARKTRSTCVRSRPAPLGA